MEWLSESKEHKNNPTVSVQDLKKNITSFGSGPVNQALEALRLKGVIELIKKGNDVYVESSQ